MEVILNNVARRFIVCAPKFDDGAFSPFGRSTHRSLALYLDSPHLNGPKERLGGLLFTKDYWREDSTRTKRELDIYGLLAMHQIPHVAEMETGGDVVDMRTITQECVGTTSADPLPGNETSRLQKLQAHRVFLKDTGRDLTTFCNAKDLVTCVADAMEAHQAAFDRACILYRDISVGNIMISPRHRGFLVDWDHWNLAIHVCEPPRLL
ncbi:uncharacterized protein BT62DRAFT_893154 [Guyanagaster necrorhizus]|uniref:Fungal-type protein kinase domain-containing protein n=1 Tax=Guyanagaster necrorhizus TaxID=856835 RepID=A0A9P8ATL0_9AGAR|nr:uncharacterized protein BT62DRAFT_893154 [Guyanagaster necrorhizus MCA 3950]KAG7447111.1 hypothetical protein BT62DRAFT_893154 [Guyanagaster necrorhizus MCA 3950]